MPDVGIWLKRCDYSNPLQEQWCWIAESYPTLGRKYASNPHALIMDVT